MGRIDGCESDRHFASAGHFLRASRHGANVAVGVRVAARPGKSVPSAGISPDDRVGTVIPPDESVGSVTGTDGSGGTVTSMAGSVGRVIAGAAETGVWVGGRVGRGVGVTRPVIVHEINARNIRLIIRNGIGFRTAHLLRQASTANA